MRKKSFVYIITNAHHTTLYVGVTTNLNRRIAEHKQKRFGGFSKKYNVFKLVYFEVYEYIENAISREKRLKGGSRRKKVELITSRNPGWIELEAPQSD